MADNGYHGFLHIEGLKNHPSAIAPPSGNGALWPDQRYFLRTLWCREHGVLAIPEASYDYTIQNNIVRQY